MPPRVSVIVPCYKTTEYVAETLDSILAQTYRDFEIVLVNDGSPDTPELEKVLEPYMPHLVYVRKENGGLASARNAGVRVARGEFVALLDSDDIWLPDYLKVQVAQLDANPDADIVFPNAVVFGPGEPGDQLILDTSAPIHEVTLTSLVTEKTVVFVSVLARKAALERAGLFDASLRRCEDFDMWLRCTNAGSRIIYHYTPLVRYRRRQGSLSADHASMAATAAGVVRKLLQTLTLTEGERAAFEEKVRFFEGSQLFYEGKTAFVAGDLPLALEKMTAAHEKLRTFRLRLLVLILRVAPGVARSIYCSRSSSAV